MKISYTTGRDVTLDHGSPAIRVSRRSRWPQRPAGEIVADYFAGCVLVPKRLLTAAYYGGIQSLRDLAQLFDVSQEAIAVRLAQVGLTDPEWATKHRPIAPARTARYYRSTLSQLMEVAQ